MTVKLRPGSWPAETRREIYRFNQTFRSRSLKMKRALKTEQQISSRDRMSEQMGLDLQLVAFDFKRNQFDCLRVINKKKRASGNGREDQTNNKSQVRFLFALFKCPIAFRARLGDCSFRLPRMIDSEGKSLTTKQFAR